MSVASSSANANQRTVHHSGSGTLNAQFGQGAQQNYDQRGTHNRYLNVDTITNYYEASHPESPAPPPTHTIPYLRDDSFVERPELALLEGKIARSGARVALYGLGGVGKSQLAIEYCYRTREKSPSTWVLWIHASTAARFDHDVRKLADDVRIPRRDESNANIFRLVYDWLMDGSRRWMLVLDNVDDVAYLLRPPLARKDNNHDSSPRPRIEYLPVCEHGAIIVTTRRRTIAAKLAGLERSVELKPDKEHAMSLVRSGLTRAHDAETVEKLALVLDCMPLAIAQATAYIRKEYPRCTLEKYIEMLEESSDIKAQLLREESGFLRQDVREAHDSVLLTWQISMERIQSLDRAAADLLSLMSFYNHQGIPEALLGVASQQPVKRDTSGLNKKGIRGFFKNVFTGSSDRHTLPDQTPDRHGHPHNFSTPRAAIVNTSISILRDYSFVSVSPDGHTFEMHRLVQLATQTWLTQKGWYSWWETQSLQQLDSAFPVAEHAQWKICQMLYPHAKLLLGSSTVEREAQLSLSSISYKAAWFACSQGLYKQAEAAAKQSKNIRESMLGADDRDTLASVGMLATVLQHQGKYEDAEAIYRRALDGYEKALGKEHPDTLTIVGNLAGVLRDQGKYEESEAMYRRGVERYAKVLGIKHPETLTSVGNPAQYQGKYEEAEAMNRRTLEGYEKMLGKEHPSTLVSVGNLAGVLQYQGKYEEAEVMNRRALEGCEKVLGKEHPDTLISVWRLASLLQVQGNNNAALELYERASAGFAKVLGPSHPHTVRCQQELLSLQTTSVK